MTRQLGHVELAAIDMPVELLREVDKAWVETLAAMIRDAGGLLQPIEVAAAAGGRYRLVYGVHRLKAMQQLGETAIPALVDEEPGDDRELRLRAAMENVGRRELSKLDRAIHVALLHAEWSARLGERRGRPKRHLPPKPGAENSGQDVHFFGLAEKIGEQVGLSERHVRRYVAIANGIGSAIRHRIVSTQALAHLVKDQAGLLLLAEQDEDGKAGQRRILDVIQDPSSHAKTVAEALHELRKEPVKPQTDKIFRRTATNLTYLRIEQRAQLFETYRDEIVDLVLAKGWLR